MGWMILLQILLWSVLGALSLLISYVLLIIISSFFVDRSRDYDTDSRYYRFLLYSATALAVFFGRIHVHVTGQDKLPEGRFLMVGNHRSKFDPILTWHVWRDRQLCFISKPENLKIFALGSIIHRCRFMAIDRENPRKAVRTIDRAASMIADGSASVFVYPEGTRNYEEGLLPFHNAVFKIAQKARAPIVVICVRGADQIQHQFPLHRSDVFIDVLDVIDADTVKSLRTAEIGDRVQADLYQKLNEEA